MLLDLKVSDFAIIDNIHIEFTEGFNVLSGETGAGKSVLLKSLSLLMGGKAVSDSVRTGRSQALIEGYFDISHRADIREQLEMSGIETEEDTLIVRRVISSQGKSKVYLNGSISPLSLLKTIVSPLIEMTGEQAPLIEMTGQHDNKHLQNKSYHLELLDIAAGCNELRHNYRQAHEKVLELENQLEQLNGDEQSQAQRLDFLKYQADEIRALELKPGEEEELENKVKRMRSSAQLSEFVNLSQSLLSDDTDAALTRIDRVRDLSANMSKHDSELSQQAHLLDDAKAILEEWLFFLQKYSDHLDDDEASMDQAQEELSRLRKLQKKYGQSVEDILAQLEDIESEIDQIENFDLRREEIRKLLKEAALVRKNLATELHKKRQETSSQLAKSVNKELLDLNMKGLQFSLRVDSKKDFGYTGISEVEFLTQTSKSDTPRPLAKFASGGELSRILLAIKQVVGSGSQPRTYLFDEVDTGVSGETAEKVGRKLHKISQGQQVICVTHLPQVAAFADTHYLIEKSPNKKSVQMNVKSLNQKDRVQEVARLLSGEKITKTSLQHAEQLIESTEGH